MRPKLETLTIELSNLLPKLCINKHCNSSNFKKSPEWHPECVSPEIYFVGDQDLLNLLVVVSSLNLTTLMHTIQVKVTSLSLHPASETSHRSTLSYRLYCDTKIPLNTSVAPLFEPSKLLFAPDQNLPVWKPCMSHGGMHGSCAWPCRKILHVFRVAQSEGKQISPGRKS